MRSTDWITHTSLSWFDFAEVQKRGWTCSLFLQHVQSWVFASCPLFRSQLVSVWFTFRDFIHVVWSSRFNEMFRFFKHGKIRIFLHLWINYFLNVLKIPCMSNRFSIPAWLSAAAPHPPIFDSGGRLWPGAGVALLPTLHPAARRRYHQPAQSSLRDLELVDICFPLLLVYCWWVWTAGGWRMSLQRGSLFNTPLPEGKYLFLMVCLNCVSVVNRQTTSLNSHQWDEILIPLSMTQHSSMAPQTAASKITTQMNQHLFYEAALVARCT